MEAALTFKKEEKKSHAVAEAQPDSALSQRELSGAPAGIPLFLQSSCASAGGFVQRRPDNNRSPGNSVPTRLNVGPPGDSFEREADRIADEVVSKPAHGASAGNSPALSSPKTVQRKCDACSTGAPCAECEKESAVQLKAESASIASAAFIDEQSLKNSGSGQPLSAGVRSFMESRFGSDFANVRIHTDDHAASLTTNLHAQAFTHGHDIYFASNRFQPETSEGRRLLAHELAHTVQQEGHHSAANSRAASPMHGGNSAANIHDGHAVSGKGSVEPVRASTHTSGPVVQRYFGESVVSGIGSGIKSAASTVYEAGETVVETGAEVVEAGVELAGDALLALVREVSPGLADMIELGPTEFIKRAIETVIQDWIPSLFGDINLGESVDNFKNAFGEIFTSLGALLSGEGSACDAFANLLGGIRDLVHALMNNPVVDALKSVFEFLSDGIKKIAEFVLAPVFDLVKDILGGAWEAIKTIASTVWGWISDVRDLASSAWDWVAEQLGFSGDEAGGEEGILGWIKRKASAIWESIKETFAPIVGPLKTVGTILLALSPIGPIYLLIRYGPQVVKSIQWLWAHRNDPDIVRNSHAEMSDTILPDVIDAVVNFKDKLSEGVNWLLEQVSALASGLLELVGGLAGVPLLSMAQSLVETISEGVHDLAAWGEDVLRSIVTTVEEVAAWIWSYIEPYKEVLSSIAMAIINPGMIPMILAGWAWELIPRCIKVPIIDFILDILIEFLSAAPEFVWLGPLWPLLKSGILGFLRGLRRQSPEAKEAVSNKIAKIIRGSSPEFIFGFVKGFLIGIWEGITDPIKAIWMVVEGLNWVQTYLERLAEEAITGKKRQPATQGAAAAAAPATAPATATASPAATGAQTTAAPAAAASTATATAAPSTATAATPATDLGPDVASGPAPQLTPEATASLGARASEMATELQPQVAIVTGGFWDAISEYFNSSGGDSFDTLMTKLGEAWEAMRLKIEEAAGELADKVVAFFNSDEAEGKLGESVGWLAGTIVFQVVLDYITAGTWIAAYPILQLIVKFLNWPMEALGSIFKLLGKLGKYIVDGIKKLGSMVTDAAGGALKAVKEALGIIGEKLMKFADELMAKLGMGTAREGTQLAEREAQRLAQEQAERTAQREAQRLAEQRAAKTGTKEGEQLAQKEADDVARQGEKKAQQESEDAAQRSAREASEKPAAVAQARAIASANDAVNTPVALLLAQLLAMKGQYSWIKTFEAHPKGIGRYSIHMIASDTEVDEDYTTDTKPPKGTPEGDEWRYERYKEEKAALGEEPLPFDEWYSRSRGGRSGGPGHQEIQNKLIADYKYGGRPRTEAPVGDRFADAYWPKGPDGKPVYHQIGGKNPGRLDPISREREAIEDIRKEVGKDVDIYFWDKTNPNAPPLINPDLKKGWVPAPRGGGAE